MLPEALSLSVAATATQPQEVLVAYEQALVLDARLVRALAGKVGALRVPGQDGVALAAYDAVGDRSLSGLPRTPWAVVGALAADMPPGSAGHLPTRAGR
jgi:hypothetical protein